MCLTLAGSRRKIAHVETVFVSRTPTDFADISPLAMTIFCTRLSAAVAWAMIPLAAWTGMHTTGCVCANGHLKLYCQHALAGRHSTATAAGYGSTCCCHEEEETDCCGGRFCCDGGNSGESHIGAKSCCNPIVSAPSVAPETVSMPCDQAPAIVAVAHKIGTLLQPSLAFDVAEFDTGQQFDRVIVFRSLLI